MELVRAKKDIGFDEFCRLLYSDFTEEYDPVIKYFEGLKKWDGSTDYIKELSETITLKDSKQEQQWQKCLRRWLIGYVACAVNSDTVNQTAIILVGLQGIGKSRWLNRLVPEELAKYRFEGTINPDNKDTLIFLSECMLINLDELETLRKSEIGALKTLMTMQAVKVRRPYGRLAEDLARRASFVGSINQTEFLNDATGSRRFLVFETNKVDIDKLPDINNVLAQAYELYKQGERWWFDTAEIAKINMHNKEYAVATYEEELLLQFATPNPTNIEWKSATEIAEYIRTVRDKFIVNDKSVRNLGIALTKHGYESKKTNGTKKYQIGWV